MQSKSKPKGYLLHREVISRGAADPISDRAQSKADLHLEIDRLRTEVSQLRQWLKAAYKWKDTPSSRQRSRPKQLPFPTSDLR